MSRNPVNYEPKSAESNDWARMYLWIAFAVAVAGNIFCITLPVYTFLEMPSGTIVRPLGLIGKMLNIALITGSISIFMLLLFYLFSQRRGHSNLIAIGTILLALSPFFAAIASIRIMIHCKGLINVG